MFRQSLQVLFSYATSIDADQVKRHFWQETFWMDDKWIINTVQFSIIHILNSHLFLRGEDEQFMHGNPPWSYHWDNDMQYTKKMMA